MSDQLSGTRLSASTKLWLGTLLGAVLMSVLVLLTADDAFVRHLPEIIGATIGIHIAIRLGRSS